MFKISYSCGILIVNVMPKLLINLLNDLTDLIINN